MIGISFGHRRIAALLLLAAACVSTDGGDLQDLPVCATNRSDDDVADAIIEVSVAGPEGSTSCNGVLIAPQLVLTATSCVAVRVPDADINVPRCQWPTAAPIEDGRLEARYLASADLSSISLRRGDDVLESRVERLFISEATSVCQPNIAILAIQPALNAPRVALRLDGMGRIGDSVTVTGLDYSEGFPAQHTSDAVIVESTTDSGSASLPPRALLLSGRACTSEGGAVLAGGTGALIGLITSSALTIRCMAKAAGPLAVQLAPFRQFVLETARAVETTLFSELREDGPPSLIAPCERP